MSRSTSPESSQSSAPTNPFFQSVSRQGFPDSKVTKAQPWKKNWAGEQQPTEDGKLIVACPKVCTYGMFTVIRTSLIIRATPVVRLGLVTRVVLVIQMALVTERHMSSELLRRIARAQELTIPFAGSNNLGGL